jgi:hypothetical protein
VFVVYRPKTLGVCRNYDAAGKTSYLGKKFSYPGICCPKGGMGQTNWNL